MNVKSNIFQENENSNVCLLLSTFYILGIFVRFDRIDRIRDCRMLLFDIPVRFSDHFRTTDGSKIVAMGNIVFLCDDNTVRYHSCTIVCAILLIFLFPFQTQRFPNLLLIT